MTMAGLLIQIPPMYCVPWTGGLTFLNLTLLSRQTWVCPTFSLSSLSCSEHWGISSLWLGEIPVDCVRSLAKTQQMARNCVQIVTSWALTLRLRDQGR